MSPGQEAGWYLYLRSSVAGAGLVVTALPDHSPGQRAGVVDVIAPVFPPHIAAVPGPADIKEQEVSLGTVSPLPDPAGRHQPAHQRLQLGVGGGGARLHRPHIRPTARPAWPGVLLKSYHGVTSNIGDQGKAEDLLVELFFTLLRMFISLQASKGTDV